MAAQSCVGSVSGTASIKSEQDEERLDFNTKEVQDSNDSSQMPQFVMTFEESEKLMERFELETHAKFVSWKTDKKFSVSNGKVDDKSNSNGKIDKKNIVLQLKPKKVGKLVLIIWTG